MYYIKVTEGKNEKLKKESKMRISILIFIYTTGAQWLSGRVLDSRPKGRGFEPHRRHCVVSLSKNINPSLVLVHSRKTRPFITERLLMGRKESNQTKRNKIIYTIHFAYLKVYTKFENTGSNNCREISDRNFH